MNIQMRNHKLSTEMPEVLEHAVKCRFNQNFTLDDISSTLKDVRKRTNIGKYSPYKSHSFREEQPFRVDNKDKPRVKVDEVAKKTCHNCGLMKILRKNRTASSIAEEPLGKIRGHDIELYLVVERPYTPMLRRPPYQASLETRNEIEKHVNELLDMDVIRKIGYNGILCTFQSRIRGSPSPKTNCRW
ncbi:hypothetical protein O181_010871 [Austropuccinia psidii MF-1]|uniref:Uncharacterized protein n=1 Tax=Austropuccinia psidii MF-1 TaxID=1389203 RepID=A0A9Q3BUP9_9BASI|nr:hypothetical protein [Austropuccinia psidii MF-1]